MQKYVEDFISQEGVCPQNGLEEDMRKEFAKALHKEMKKNENIFLLTGDLGFKLWDEIKKDFPDRFVNCGAAEQAMVGIAVGLALKGKIPFVYSITPFLIYRPFETIKIYLDGEKIPVILVGSGRDKEYSHDGPSHDATDIKKTLDTMPNILQYWPKTKKEVTRIVRKTIKSMDLIDLPIFISLKRG